MQHRLQSALPWLVVAVIALGAWRLWPNDGAPSPSPLDPSVLAAALAEVAGTPPEDERSERDATLADAGPGMDLDWQPKLPRDLGAHPEAGAELWDLTGALRDDAGARYGLRLTLIRLGLPADDLPDGDGVRPAGFATDALLLGRAALIPESGEPIHAELVSRAAAGLAGAAADQPRVWIEDWELIGSDRDGRGRLRFSIEDKTLELALIPVKPVLTPSAALLTSGQPGDAGNAGPRWFSQPRMTLAGRLLGAGEARDLEGTAWLDRAWGDDATVAASPGGTRGQLALNRFLLQLDDGTELLCIQLRRRTGGGTPVPTCLLNPKNGKPEVLRRRALALTPKQVDWYSAPSGAEYPLHWRLDAPTLGLELDVDALRPNQELPLAEPIWSGSVTARGSRNDAPIVATGRMDLSGYGPSRGG